MHYRVQGVTEWSNWYTGETPVTRAVITNLQADTAYEVRVHNTNAIGSSSWAQATTAFRTRANTPATGAPTITGMTAVGEVLTASTTGIADADGLPASFSYQWVRVDADGTNPVDIPVAIDATYTLTDDDLGKKVKVTVSFTDDLETTETLTSEAYPSSGTVAADATCPAPDFAGRRKIWTAVLTMGNFTIAPSDYRGYARTPGSGDGGELHPTTFAVGSNEHEIVILALAGRLNFILELPTTWRTTNANALRLHVCNTNFDFSDSSFDTVEGIVTPSHSWDTDLDWASVSTRTVYLSLPDNRSATGAPVITGTAQVGQELSADVTGIEDEDGLYGAVYTYQWGRVDADGTSNPVDITDATDATYTLTDDDLGKKVKVTVSFTDYLGSGEQRTSAPTAMATAPAMAGELRLMDGTGDHEGRLEIRYKGQWGTVCDDYWTDVEAGVVCRILEFELGAVDNMGRTRDEGGRSLPPLYFGAADADDRMWLDNVNCEGNETSLFACPRHGNLAVGVHNCRPREAVGVQCRIMPQVELVAVSPASGPYTAGGTLQVTVEWNQPVVVTTPAGGLAPKLVVGYDTGGVIEERDAVYASGSGTAALVFEHRLAGGDSFESVKVLPDTLRVRGGAIVWKTDNGVDADLAHGTIVNNQLEAPVVVAPPVVVGVPVLSEAGTDGLWTAGETVEVQLTFSEPVSVGTAGGTPSIGLRLGTQAQSAAYASGSGTAKLVFVYTLADGEGPHNTMQVTGDSLALNGGTIVSTADSTIDADLAHDGVAESAVPEPVPARATRGVADGPTAYFSGMPSSHDGEKPFTVKLSFSAEPRGLSDKTVRDSLLEVTGGTVTKALRVTDASDREWNVTVKPSQGYDRCCHGNWLVSAAGGE